MLVPKHQTHLFWGGCVWLMGHKTWEVTNTQFAVVALCPLGSPCLQQCENIWQVGLHAREHMVLGSEASCNQELMVTKLQRLTLKKNLKKFHWNKDYCRVRPRSKPRSSASFLQLQRAWLCCTGLVKHTFKLHMIRRSVVNLLQCPKFCESQVM